MIGKQDRFLHLFRGQCADKSALLKDLEERLVRNLIKFLDCFSLHIDFAGRSQDIDQPGASKILREKFPNQADLD